MTQSLFGSIWEQYFPPQPAFTDRDVPGGSQVGKVFLVTGANQGIGFELVKMLYSSGATIYMAGRSMQRLEEARSSIVSGSTPDTPATLKTLHLDLADLASVKTAAEEFLKQETRLDILWNNAALGGGPNGTSTVQGLEGHIGTNCVAVLLFTQKLLPLLQAATKNAAPDSVRIIWTGSLAIEQFAPKDGMDFKLIETGKTTNSLKDYSASKTGNWFLCHEATERWGKYGIISVVQNPGNLDTQAYRYQSWVQMLLVRLVLYEPRFGAYTLLYSGFSGDITAEKNGAYIRPWGRLKENGRKDVYEAIRKGRATEFWEWCERKFAAFV